MKKTINCSVMVLLFFCFCYLFCGFSFFGCGKVADTTTSSTTVTTSTSTTSTSTSTTITTSTTTTLPYVATPTFSLSSGSYEATSLYITIECATTGEVDIYYSLDGTIPTTTESILYSSPISIEASKIVRAIAVKSEMQNSLVATHWYDLYWWQALGDGMNNSVNTLLYVSSEACLYAGGGFTAAGGVNANYIAKWNGTAWEALGKGMSSGVYSLAYGEDTGSLYAGGDFLTSEAATRVTTRRIAKWNGISWEALGSGASNRVLALTYDNNTHSLYAGGVFTTIGGISAKRVAKWSGSIWEDLGGGVNSTVTALAFDTINNHLYAGGLFNIAGAISANYIARYSGVSWEAIESPINSNVNALLYDSFSDQLFVASDLNSSHKLVKYDWTGWHDLWRINPVGGSPYAIAYNSATDVVSAGGDFSSIEAIGANCIAKYLNNTWEAYGSGVGSLSTAYIYAIACDRSTNTLYAGGIFTSAGGISANYVAKWGKIN